VLTALLVITSGAASLVSSPISLAVVLALTGIFLSPVMIVAYFAANAFGRPARQTESTTWVNTSHNVGAAAVLLVTSVALTAKPSRSRCSKPLKSRR